MPSHRGVARLCLIYLIQYIRPVVQESSGIPSPPPGYVPTTGTVSVAHLAPCAADRWFEHVHKTGEGGYSGPLQAVIIKFFDCQSEAFDIWVNIYDPVTRMEPISPLYYAAWLVISIPICALLDAEHDIDAEK